MTEIVLDLEWNGAPCPSINAYFNEIIEIGAVKLDDDMHIVDEFRMTVRPTVSRKLTHIVKNLTRITEEELAAGTDFCTAFQALSAWVGKPPVALLTWSNTDLGVLLENMRYYKLGDHIPFITHYADVQPYCQRLLKVEGNNQISLEHACELAEIQPNDVEFHRALDDSRLTGKLLEKVYDPASFASILQPTDAIFYERFLFKTVILSDPTDPQIEASAFKFTCPDCGKSLQRKGKFKFTHRAFCCEMVCRPCHKRYLARVQCKRHYDGVDIRRKLTEKKEPPKTDAAPEVTACETTSLPH